MEQWRPMSQEIAVAVSDALLAAWTGALAVRTIRNRNSPELLRRWFGMALGFTALAALLGGLWHGIFAGSASLPGTALWRATMLAIGVAAFGLLQISVLMIGTERQRTRAGRFGLASFILYSAFVLFYSDDFALALAYYVPITLLFLFGCIGNRRERFASFGFLYVGLTVAAAVVQHLQLGLHPVYCNHNVVYHLVQGAANYYLHLTGREWPAGPTVPST